MKIKIKHTSAIKSIDCKTCLSKGDWIDLRSGSSINIYGPEVIKDSGGVIRFTPTTISLGVAIQLPKGFEAILAPRSSSFKSFGFIMANSIGVIDNSYCGNDDQWKITIIGMKNGRINQGDRIAQFRIQPSQFASVWVKLKWLFVRKIEFITVDSLNNTNRGGFGSIGKKQT